MKKLVTLVIVALFSHILAFGQCSISGSSTACVGSILYLSVDSTCSPSGTWSCSPTTVATVNPAYGNVMGISAGIATVTFTPTSGTAVTRTITVNPSPTAISGSGTVCVGSTITLSDATGGGTWSSSYSFYATVSSAGVITGVAAGTDYIYYTLPTGCAATHIVTVSSTTLSDSLTGPSIVCSGSSITLTTTATGGTWSSSSTAVATVGSSTGIVTGISSGVTFISYTVTGGACGTSSVSMPVTVNAPTSAGTIYGGSTTVVIGSTISLWDSYATGTGTWVSAEPGIATVDGSGNVTGVSAGIATIEYIVTGCTGTDTAIMNITVTTLDGIAGKVIFDTTCYCMVKVWLIHFEPSTLLLTALDSVNLYCGGSSVAYSFSGLSTDSFRVKAALDSTSGLTSGFIPTYHDSSYHWNTASVVYFTSGSTDTGVNIHMRAGVTTSGPGFIAGNVLSGADKGTSGGVPVEGMLIYVVNQTTGVELQKTLTDASGNYSFSNLPVGETYLIYPEAINYTTTVYPSINLTSTSPSMSVADFKQHTVSKTITPILEGVNNVSASTSVIDVYPNPATGSVNISWNVKTADHGIVTIADMSGRELIKNAVDLSAGNGKTQLSVAGLATGAYTITIKSDAIYYSTIINIAK